MVKRISFTKTPLLIIVSGMIIYDLNAINKGMLVEKSNKCCIDIAKGTNNLRQKFRKEDTYCETEGVLKMFDLYS